MKKKLLALILCFALLGAIPAAATMTAPDVSDEASLPATAVAFNNADYTVSYEIHDGQYLISTADGYSISETSENALAYFEASSNDEPSRLTLMGDVPGFMFTGTLTIKLTQDVTVSAYTSVATAEGYTGSAFGFCIRGTGAYTIDAAPYTLTAISPEIVNPEGNAFSAAISNSDYNSTLTIASGTVYAVGGSVEGLYCGSYGINAYGTLEITGGTVYAFAGSATATLDSAATYSIAYSNALRGATAAYISGGTIYAQSGTVIARQLSNGKSFETAGTLASDYALGYVTVKTGESGTTATAVEYLSAAMYNDAFISFEAGAWTSYFTDVTEEFDYITKIASLGIMNGVEAGVFSADETSTRAMAAVVLHRLVDCIESENEAMTFSDVESASWYETAVNWASAEGVIEGYEGNFMPKDEITVEDFITMLHRLSGDEGQIGDWAMSMGMMTASEDITIALTRGEMARILSLYIG